jgi:hypothetical protein
MSALGQKQHVRCTNPCPLYSQLRLQKRTSALRHVRFTAKSGHVQCIHLCVLWAKSGHSQPSLWVTYASLAECRVFTIKEATMLKTVVLAMGLMAIPSIAQTQQQQCQLECTWVNGKGEKTRVSRSCHGLNASDCVNLGRAETGGNKTCRGYITSECVQDR